MATKVSTTADRTVRQPYAAANFAARRAGRRPPPDKTVPMQAWNLVYRGTQSGPAMRDVQQAPADLRALTVKTVAKESDLRKQARAGELGPVGVEKAVAAEKAKHEQAANDRTDQAVDALVTLHNVHGDAQGAPLGREFAPPPERVPEFQLLTTLLVTPEQWLEQADRAARDGDVGRGEFLAAYLRGRVDEGGAWGAKRAELEGAERALNDALLGDDPYTLAARYVRAVTPHLLAGLDLARTFALSRTPEQFAIRWDPDPFVWFTPLPEDADMAQHFAAALNAAVAADAARYLREAADGTATLVTGHSSEAAGPAQTLADASSRGT
jgi:hypothetical protein